jgi:hypothetical protein
MFVVDKVCKLLISWYFTLYWALNYFLYSTKEKDMNSLLVRALIFLLFMSSSIVAGEKDRKVHAQVIADRGTLPAIVRMPKAEDPMIEDIRVGVRAKMLKHGLQINTMNVDIHCDFDKLNWVSLVRQLQKTKEDADGEITININVNISIDSLGVGPMK